MFDLGVTLFSMHGIFDDFCEKLGYFGYKIFFKTYFIN